MCLKKTNLSALHARLRQVARRALNRLTSTVTEEENTYTVTNVCKSIIGRRRICILQLHNLRDHTWNSQEYRCVRA